MVAGSVCSTDVHRVCVAVGGYGGAQRCSLAMDGGKGVTMSIEFITIVPA